MYSCKSQTPQTINAECGRFLVLLRMSNVIKMGRGKFTKKTVIPQLSSVEWLHPEQVDILMGLFAPPASFCG